METTAKNPGNSIVYPSIGKLVTCVVTPEAGSARDAVVALRAQNDGQQNTSNRSTSAVLEKCSNAFVRNCVRLVDFDEQSS